MAVAGNYAYVVDATAGLYIIDVSLPSAPAEVGFCILPDDAFDVAVAGNYAYVADGNRGLRIIDVSLPSAPIEVGFSNTSAMP